MRTVRPRFTEAQYRYARDEASALEYAQRRGYELKKEGSLYRMRSHDSMVFTTDGRWFWNSHSLRGRAIEFAMFYEDMTLPEAVLSICEVLGAGTIPAAKAKEPPQERLSEKKPFVLPPQADGNKRLFAYLCQTRKLDREIVAELVRQGNLYESAQPFRRTNGSTDFAHNAVFVGRDRAGVPKSAFQRGLSSLPNRAPFKGDVSGSDAAAAFLLHGRDDASTVAVFEAAIDAISHATIYKMDGQDWRDIDRLAIGGTQKTVGLMSYLEEHPSIRWVQLCYDCDAAGDNAAERTLRLLDGKGYQLSRIRPPCGKDWNDYLIQIVGGDDQGVHE